MLKKLKYMLILVIVLCNSALYSESNGNKTGTSSFTWLKVGPSARAVSLGGSYIGVANDASSLYYNPAGMVLIENPEVVASFNNWYANTPHMYGGVVIPLKSMNAAMGVQVGYYSSGDIDETTPVHSQGTGRKYQTNYMMFGASYAQMLTSKFYFGATGKVLYGGIADESVVTGALDLGTYYNTQWKSLIFGMSIRNFGGTVEYIEDENEIPMEFVFGVSVTPYKDDSNKINALLEAAHPNDNAEYVMMGVEYSFNNMFFVRLGRKLNGCEYSLFKSDRNSDVDKDKVSLKGGVNFAGTSVGFGVNLDNIGLKLDYAYSNHEDLGHTNMLTLGYSLK